MTEIIIAVAKWMNVSLTFIREPEDSFGTWENNTWNGMVGMLYRNEVDLILNPILPKDSILEFAHFTNAITVDAYTILSGKKSQEAGLFLYFSVLDTKVWLAIIVAAVAIAVTSAAVFRSVTMSQHFNWVSTSGQYCWILLSYMLRQNPTEKYLLRKSKMKPSIFLPFLTTLWIFCIGFLVMNVIQSLLVSKLTVKKSEPFVGILADLLKTDSTVGIAPVEIQLGDVLESSGIPVYEAAWEKIKQHLMTGKKVFSDQTIEDVQKGKFCIFHGHLIFENRLREFYKKTSLCQLHLSEHYFFPFPLLLAMQRHVPPSIYEAFNFGITRLVDADISGKSLKGALEVSNLCTSHKEKRLKSMGLKNIYGVLLVWAVGLISGAVVLLCEIIYNTFQ